MNSLSLIEFEQQVKCGEWEHLKCSCGKLASVHGLMRQVDLRTIPMMERILCGCDVTIGEASQEPETSTTGQNPSCTQRITQWVADHRGALNAAQLTCAAITALGVDYLSQLSAVLGQVLEQIEDVATGASELAAGDETITWFCNAFRVVDDVVAKLRQVAAGSSTTASALGTQVGRLAFLSEMTNMLRDCCEAETAAGGAGCGAAVNPGSALGA